MRTLFHTLIFVAVSTFVPTAFGVAQPIKVNGGNQTMTISSGIAGGQPVSVLNTTCTLAYKKQSKISKISVSTSCPGQSFNLSVVATSVTKGTPAPQVSLVNGNPAMDLVTDIPTTGGTNATCRLNFTASATFSQGNSTELGNDVHAITYTILAQ